MAKRQALRSVCAHASRRSSCGKQWRRTEDRRGNRKLIVHARGSHERAEAAVPSRCFIRSYSLPPTLCGLSGPATQRPTNPGIPGPTVWHHHRSPSPTAILANSSSSVPLAVMACTMPPGHCIRESPPCALAVLGRSGRHHLHKPPCRETTRSPLTGFLVPTG